MANRNSELSPRVAVVFISHRFAPRIIRHLDLLKRGCPENHEFFVLSQAGSTIPPELQNERIRFFDWNRIKTLARKLVKDTVITNCHLFALEFQNQEPAFDFYWFIEYDVFFSGDWRGFLATMAKDPADFLGMIITPYERDPAWHWWKTLRVPNGGLSQSKWLRAFMPVYRISHLGLDSVRERVRQGWVGHFEALVPSAIQDASLRISDIGGVGLFTPPHRRGLYYRAAPQILPTISHRPCFMTKFARRFPLMRNTLYHPVKPHSGGRS